MCKVGNSGQTVELLQTSGEANSRGQLNIFVEASSELSERVNVMVDIYDGITDTRVNTVVITIDNSSANKLVTGLTPNKAYYFKIRQAVSCN